MSEMPEKRLEGETDSGAQGCPQARGDALGRVLFLLAGGVLLATLVSCACGPVR